MNMEGEETAKLEPAFVRDELDAILACEITALLDVGSNLVMMSFNLASITCVTLIVEREHEIKKFTDFPPERFTKTIFFDELTEIGLEKDDSLEMAVDSVIQKGYISTDSKGELKAEMPSFMMAGFLDNMFPGMLGMNLVAFILQMNDEVNQGRKTLELAKNSFKATLKSRGVAVSNKLAGEKEDDTVQGQVYTPPTISKAVSQKLKKDNLNRLSKFVGKRKKTGSGGSGQLKIKDLFDKGPTKEEIDENNAQLKKAEQDAEKAAELAKELALKDEKIREAQEVAKKAERQLALLEQREKELEEAREKAEIEAQKAAEIEERETLMAQKEERLKALEEKFKLEEEEKIKKEEERQKKIEDEEKEKASKNEDDIEAQIAALESNLTMPCPMCNNGEIVSKTTAKGKEFFSCNKSDCRFVSWGKPYHFECPLCKNSFLIETVNSNGEKGLKCPRASCSYTQNNLFDPKQSMEQAIQASKPKKKRKRIVRRRKRR